MNSVDQGAALAGIGNLIQRIRERFWPEQGTPRSQHECGVRVRPEGPGLSYRRPKTRCLECLAMRLRGPGTDGSLESADCCAATRETPTIWGGTRQVQRENATAPNPTSARRIRIRPDSGPLRRRPDRRSAARRRRRPHRTPHPQGLKSRVEKQRCPGVEPLKGGRPGHYRQHHGFRTPRRQKGPRIQIRPASAWPTSI
jgi:hypothetical protein